MAPDPQAYQAQYFDQESLQVAPLQQPYYCAMQMPMSPVTMVPFSPMGNMAGGVMMCSPQQGMQVMPSAMQLPSSPCSDVSTTPEPSRKSSGGSQQIARWQADLLAQGFRGDIVSKPASSKRSSRALKRIPDAAQNLMEPHRSSRRDFGSFSSGGGYAEADSGAAMPRGRLSWSDEMDLMEESQFEQGSAISARTSRSSWRLQVPPAASAGMLSEESKDVLVDQLEAGGSEREQAMERVQGNVLQMSFDLHGCRVVQVALEVADTATKEKLAAELQGHVYQAVVSPHANYVVQKIIEVIRVGAASFVAEELRPHAGEIVRHRFGCRIFSRLVEHHLQGSSSSNKTKDLIDSILIKVDELIHHTYARHVMELILEHGPPEYQRKVVESIYMKRNLFRNAKNRNASYVIEKALFICSIEDRHAIASELVADREAFVQLAVHQSGRHVVQAVLGQNNEVGDRAKAILRSSIDTLRASKFGKALVSEL